jgi:phospholipid/cholesterol/gamma-HCH transport system ATP-binding protein
VPTAGQPRDVLRIQLRIPLADGAYPHVIGAALLIREDATGRPGPSGGKAGTTRIECRSFEERQLLTGIRLKRAAPGKSGATEAVSARRGADALVSLDNVIFSRGDRRILNGLTLHVDRGRITAIMGGSGSGKTTILNLIGGRIYPDSGRVIVDDQSVPELDTEALFALRKRMALLFQTGALFTDLTVFENVAFPIREHTRLPEEILRTVVLMKLETVGLRGARDLMPSELSGGMARRVALARAIAFEPMIIMYDEPFTGLDPISKGVIAKLIEQLNETLGITSIVVSHDVAETCSISDYAYIVGEGRIIGEGTPQSLQRSSSEYVRQFMEGQPDGPVPYQHPAPEYLADLLTEKTA